MDFLTQKKWNSRFIDCCYPSSWKDGDFVMLHGRRPNILATIQYMKK